MKLKRLIRLASVCLVLIEMSAFGQGALDDWADRMQRSRPEVPPSRKAYLERSAKALPKANVDAFAEDRAIAEASLPFPLPEDARWSRLETPEAEYLSECTFSSPDGFTCRFAVYGQYGCKRAYYWTGVRAGTSADGTALTYDQGTNFVATALSRKGSPVDIRGIREVLVSAETEIAVRGVAVDCPFDRFRFILADDRPGANWAHPCRFVFIAEDGCSFAVSYESWKPKIRRKPDGARLWLLPGFFTERSVSMDEVKNSAYSSVPNGTAPGLAYYAGDVSHSYFVLICGGASPEDNGIRFWADTAQMYSTLTKKYGVAANHIHVLMSDGLNPGQDACLGEKTTGEPVLVSSPTDLDGDGTVDVDGPATWLKVNEVFNSLESTLTSQDQLFVFVTSHGFSVGTAGASNYRCGANLYSPNDDGRDIDGYYSNFYDENLQDMTKNIACPIAFAFETCFSGGFIDDLTATAQRMVATACNHYEYSWGTYEYVTGPWTGAGIGKTTSHNHWARPFISALRGYLAPTSSNYPWTDGTACADAVDANGDGRVSFAEAANYAKVNDPKTCTRSTHSSALCSNYEHPQYGESSSGLGASFWLLKQNATPVSRPANDNFANATAISGTSGSLTASSANATREIGEPYHGISSATNSVWWKWTATTAGSMTITTEDSGFDTGLGVYTGGSVSALTKITDNDDNGAGGLWSSVTFTAVAGTTYYIAVAGCNGATGSVKLNWSLSGTPSMYSIMYVLGGGTHGVTHPTSATYDTAFYVSAPARSGYTFTGWTVTSGLNTSTAKWGTSSNPSTAINSTSTKCVNGATGNVYFKNLTAMANGSVTLTANWIAAIPLSTALDNTTLTFTTGGDAGWFGQSVTKHDGTDAAQSGPITDSQSSWMQTTVSGPGTISFWWYASSESVTWDYLSFSIDGVQTNKIGGTSCFWTQCSYTLGAGTHTLKWNYRKDGSDSRGLDAGFVDQVVWTPMAMPRTLYVSTGGSDSQLGTFESEALATIQRAVNLAQDGDEIIVLDGRYEPIDTANKAITIRSANGADSTFIDGALQWSRGLTNRCARLGTSSSSTNTLMIGFTLTNGRGYGGGGVSYGRLRECRIVDNVATNGGGAYYSILENCELSGNTALLSGGGAYCGTQSNCTFDDNLARWGGGAYGGTQTSCLFSENQAETYGGGSNSGDLRDCTLEGNLAAYGGGGTCNGVQSGCEYFDNQAENGGGAYNGTQRNCLFDGNEAEQSGGGSYNGTNSVCRFVDNHAKWGGGLIYGRSERCLLAENHADNSGGGVYEGDLSNCLIIDNVAKWGGGSYTGRLSNCTLSRNEATTYGGGASNGNLFNCIAWGNSCSLGKDVYLSTCTYTCSGQVLSGEGNMTSNPQFVDADGDDFRISATSPCQNRGSNAYAAGSVDYAGNPRIVGSVVDMGAYEWQGSELIGFSSKYVVIDLSGGTTASAYPVSELNGEPFGGWTDEYKTTKLVLRRIEASTFKMGSPGGELGRSENEDLHTVTITSPYYIGVFPVTQRQWELVMGNRPANFSKDECYMMRPIENICYNDIRGSKAGAGWPASSAVDEDSFLGRIRRLSGLGTLDLPTEAEWECACRAGTTTALYSGVDLQSEWKDSNVNLIARYYYTGGGGSTETSLGVDEGGTAIVGSYRPNAWGLYDMCGNVLERCLDWAVEWLGAADVIDPVGSQTGSYRVLRGGSWNHMAGGCRSAMRWTTSYTPSYKGTVSGIAGFRIAVRTPVSGGEAPVAHSVTLAKGTGVGTIYYRFGDTGSWITYTSPFTVVEGTVISYYASPLTGYTAVRSSSNPLLMTVTSDMTDVLSATPNTYSITYAMGGGTHGTTHPASAIYGTAFYVSAPTRSGYTFAGWTVTSGLNTSTAKWGTTSNPSAAISSSSTKCVNGATGNVYFKNLTPTANGSVTLTANWTAILPTPEPFQESSDGAYALFVGINQYTLSGCSTLPCCIKDVEAMHGDCVLYGGWSEANCRELTDGLATKSNVRYMLASLAEVAEEGDTVLFYQSSHGGSIGSTADACLCMHDAEYWDYELAEDLMRFGRGVRILIVVDACRSAGLFKNGGETARPFDLAARVMKIMQSEMNAVANASIRIRPEDIGWITAADYNQNSVGGSNGSLFTLAMTDAWEDDEGTADLDGDRRLDFYELFKAAEMVGANRNPPIIGQCENEPVLKFVTARLYSGFAPPVIIGRSGEADVEIPGAWFTTGTIGGRVCFNPSKFAALFGTDYAIAAKKPTGKVDAHGNPMYVWQDFIAGTDPTDKTSEFKASISFEDGKPVITWTPDLNEGGTRSIRTYRTLGISDLSQSADPAAWREVTPGSESAYRFFKIEVELK